VFALSRGVKIAFVLQLLVLAGAVVLFALRWSEQTSEPPIPAIAAPASVPGADPDPGSDPSAGNPGTEPEPNQAPHRIGEEPAPPSAEPDGTAAEPAPDPVLPEDSGGPLVLEASSTLPTPGPPTTQKTEEPPEPRALRPAPEPAHDTSPPTAGPAPQPAQARAKPLPELPGARPRPARFAPGTPERPLRYVRGLEIWQPRPGRYGSSAVVHWSGRQPPAGTVLLRVSILDSQWFGGETRSSSRGFEGGYQSVPRAEEALSAFLVTDAQLPDSETPQPPTLTADDAPRASSPDHVETAEAGSGDGSRAPPPSMLYADGACV
jgi:hypothetical protein